MSATPPPNPPSGPPQQQPYPPPLPQYPQSEGRSVAFFVALFLGLLLLISGAVNVVLLLFSAIGSPTSMAEEMIEDSDAGYRVVAVAGSQQAKDRILRVHVQGAIAEGASPMIGASGGTVSMIRRNLRLARRPEIKGVLLEINSPGGGVTDSDEIHRLIKDFREEEKKPVIAYFGDMSASGGYYIAAACNKIFCRPTTITGSIGVIMSQYNLAKAFEKLGVKSEVIISPDTPYKDIMSMSRPMSDKERDILLSIVQEMYERFVTVVDEGRENLDREAVRKLANGQIYSAKQAVDNGLVDAILDPEEVIEEVRKLANAEKVQIVEQRQLPSVMETLFGRPAAQANQPSLADTAARYLNQTTGAKFLYFWPGGR